MMVSFEAPLRILEVTNKAVHDDVDQMIRMLVNAWSRSPLVATWQLDGNRYVYIDWTRETLSIERSLNVSAADAGRLAQRAVTRMKIERDWDADAASWDVDNDFPDWQTMAVSIRKTLLPSARRHYSSVNQTC
jgi:hypothetical protein